MLGARTLLLISTLALAACAAAPARQAPAPQAAAPASTAAPVTVPSALGKLAEHGRITVGAQPSADDLRALKAQGYTRILSVRTPGEMNDRSVVPYDEAALAAELGMSYENAPVGGNDFPFRPELADAVANALTDERSKVYLHCTVGARASMVYAAYAVKYLGMDPDAALRETEQFGMWPLALERMTGVKLKVVRAGE
jgi:protein tyrosine phosphatase (PTP) superfamily phosphohydrolase (DUF442 family)